MFNFIYFNSIKTSMEIQLNHVELHLPQKPQLSKKQHMYIEWGHICPKTIVYDIKSGPI